MENKMEYVKTEDGSITLYSKEYDEKYHTIAGAYSEALNKFIIPSNLLDDPYDKRVLDIGFGLGYNSFVLINHVEKFNPNLSIFSVEKDKELLRLAVYEKYKKYYYELYENGQININNISLNIFIGDARLVIKNFEKKFFDVVFLDPFSPPKNPELWAIQFIRELKSLLRENGRIITYSSALPVINAFIRSGFYVGYTQSFGRKRGGLIASLNPDIIKIKLSNKDIFLIKKSVRAVPNYDRGVWDKEKIFEYRLRLMERLKNMGIRLPHKKALRIAENL